MAGSEDTELRDLVLEALERNGSLAKIRALLRANIFLAFENERDPPRHNPALDRLLASTEGALALSVIAEFLDFCNLKNTAYVYKAESRQGRAYRYEGRRNLPDHLGKEHAAKQEPVLVTILRQAMTNRRKKHYEKGDHIEAAESPNKDAPRKEDDNCTYIVHDESGSTRSHSDNSSDDKNKLLLRLPLDNSDTDTSSDSARDKTHSEYIPNENIRLDPDSEDDKHLHYILSPKYVADDSGNKSKSQTKNYESHDRTEKATYTTEEHMNAVNSSDSTSYLEIKLKALLPNLPNGNVDLDLRTPNINSLHHISENIEGSSHRSPLKIESEKQSSNDSQSKSAVTNVSSNSNANQGSSKASAEKLSEQPVSSRTLDKSTKSDVKSFNYSDDFSPAPESNKTVNKPSSPNTTARSTEFDSIQEDISLNGSDRQPSSDSTGKRTRASSRSSISLSDVAELIENSAKSSPPSNGRSQPLSQYKSVIVKKSNLDEVAQRLSSLFKKGDEKRMSSTKNSSEEMSDSPIQSLSNISVDVQSD